MKMNYSKKQLTQFLIERWIHIIIALSKEEQWHCCQKGTMLRLKSTAVWYLLVILVVKWTESDDEFRLSQTVVCDIRHSVSTVFPT